MARNPDIDLRGTAARGTGNRGIDINVEDRIPLLQPAPAAFRTAPPPGTGLRNPDAKERAVLAHAEQRRRVVLAAALPKLESILASFAAKDVAALRPYSRALVTLKLFGEARDPLTPKGQASLTYLKRAQSLLVANRDASIPPFVIDEKLCTPGEYANAGALDERDPRRPFLICPVFFSARPECRAFVLMHEVFHLVGILGHGKGSSSTPEWALSNPSSLATFAWRVATGSNPYCDERTDELDPFPTSPGGVVV